MAQDERATEYPFSKFKFLSPSTVRPHFEGNTTLSPFIASVLCGKYFQSVTAKRQWKLHFFTDLPIPLGMEARKNIPLLNRKFQTKERGRKDSALLEEDESYEK